MLFGFPGELALVRSAFTKQLPNQNLNRVRSSSRFFNQPSPRSPSWSRQVHMAQDKQCLEWEERKIVLDTSRCGILAWWLEWITWRRWVPCQVQEQPYQTPAQVYPATCGFSLTSRHVQRPYLWSMESNGWAWGIAMVPHDWKYGTIFGGLNYLPITTADYIFNSRLMSIFWSQMCLTFGWRLMRTE